MVIIRINGNISPQSAEIIAKGIHSQAPTGVIILPSCCELLNEVPEDQEIQVIHQDQAARVAELEAELARAMFYISAQRACGTCKHEDTLAGGCWCRSCIEGSNWEWRGAHGSE